MKSGAEPEWKKLPRILKKELEVRRKHREFKDIRKLEEILQILRSMVKKDLQPELSQLLNVEPLILEREVREFIDPYFSKFKKQVDLLRSYKELSNDFSTNKKLYQLSHLIGIWRTRVSNQENLDQDIVNVLLGDLFIKAFESLPNILESFVALSQDNTGEHNAIGNKMQFYQNWEKRFPDGIFAKERMSESYNQLRNDLAHSSVWIEDGRVRKVGQSNKIEQLVQPMATKMKIMVFLTTYFATEVDIRLLGIAKRKNNECYEAWMEYFEIYVKWFLKIDKDLQTEK